MTFKIPAGVLEQHVIALGKTGSGKSSKLRVFVEQLLRAGEPVVILDVKGDWWGLKSSADGKRAGFPLVIFGGKHPDVPLSAGSGKEIAELVFTGNRPCIIDMRALGQGERARFFIDLASTAYKVTKGKRWLVMSEVHNFCPKGKIFSPQAGEMLHWANKLASEGRGLGINLLADSQRGQKVHNDFLTSMETLIACKVIHKSDRDAIKDWIDGCADIKVGKQVLDSLAQLKKPEAWAWCPEIDFGPELLQFPLFETFDSFKPQQADAPAQLKGWAGVDLSEVTAKLSKVVEEAKANDPAELKKRIAELERQVRAPAVTAPIDTNALELRCFDKGYTAAAAAIAGVVQAVIKTGEEFMTELRGVTAQIERRDPEPAGTPLQRAAVIRKEAARIGSFAPVRTPVKTGLKPGNGEGSSEIGAGGKRRILTALAQYPDGMNQRKLSILVDIAPKGGTWRTYMAEMRGKGWIYGGRDHMRITDAGIEALGNYEPLPTGGELIEYWRRRLGDSGKRAIFDAVVSVHPGTITVEELSEATGIAQAGGTWRTYMAELRGLGIIEGRSELRASDDLF